jgi:acetyl-CoA carboxylase carboxyl transferase subunit alpha
MHSFLEFEKPVADLQGKVHELRSVAASGEEVQIAGEIERLEEKADQALKDIYSRLTPWQKTLVARHPDRPHALDYVTGLIEDFTPLAGDRNYAEDAAVIAGIGRFRGRSVAILGQEKGSDTQSRLKHNFGMARPEGYRKAVRIMAMAERFGLPVLSFVDTAGAYPGIGAEERGQAEAIARSTDACLALGTPNVAMIIGEGGSGGAIAIASANQHEDHGPGPAAVQGHRRDHRGAARRRASRQGDCRRPGRSGHRGGAGGLRRHGRGGDPGASAQEVSGDRPEPVRLRLRLAAKTPESSGSR